MKWKLLLMIGASAAGCASLTVTVLVAQTTAHKGSATEFEQSVLPVLAKNCFTCHREKLRTANLNLEAFRNSTLDSKRPEIWEKLRQKLRSGKLPPPPMPAPAKAEVSAVTAWIDALLGTSAAQAKSDVTARRLNRVEYDNTIRDLLPVRHITYSLGDRLAEMRFSTITTKTTRHLSHPPIQQTGQPSMRSAMATFLKSRRNLA